jgi:hypothetical protein
MILGGCERKARGSRRMACVSNGMDEFGRHDLFFNGVRAMEIGEPWHFITLRYKFDRLFWAGFVKN